MIDIAAAETFVFGALSADAVLVALLQSGALSIYNQNPVGSALTPYVVFDCRPVPDTLTNGNVRTMVSFDATIQAVINENGTQTKSLADQIAGLVDADLFEPGTEQNGFWITCYRTSTWNRAPQIENRPFRYVGGKYRIDLRYPLT